MQKKYDIGIIGGGASGCMAAICAAKECGARIAIFEKNESLLKKVIASGNGRCNISNANCEGNGFLMDFFRKMGIFTREEEDGRIYPASGYSRTVSDRLLDEISALQIDVYTSCEIRKITMEDSFIIESDGESFEAGMVLVSAGGKAGPQFGTAGDSFRLLKGLGHNAGILRPVLTGIECEGNFEPLKGIRAMADVSLFKDGEKVCETERGEVQFTSYGLSGICIMNLSRYLVLDRDVPMKEAYMRYEICCDFAYDIDKEIIEEYIEILGNDRYKVYEGFVRKNLAHMAEDIKNVRFKVTGSRGWKDAQVTSGGISYDEVDEKTMESRLVKGLYISGEAMNYDGPCGGYNLNHAWMSGMKAGEAMALCIEQDR